MIAPGSADTTHATDGRVSYAPRVTFDAKTLADLRQLGVSHATFHADGSLASITFATEEAASAADDQYETPAPAPKRAMRSAPGLVPRREPDST